MDITESSIEALSPAPVDAVPPAVTPAPSMAAGNMAPDRGLEPAVAGRGAIALLGLSAAGWRLQPLNSRMPELVPGATCGLLLTDLLGTGALPVELAAALNAGLTYELFWSVPGPAAASSPLCWHLQFSPMPAPAGAEPQFVLVLNAPGLASPLDAQCHGQALQDALTGLPSFPLFVDRVGQDLRRLPRSGRRLAVLMLNIDGFAAINDSLGLAVGDLLLRALGQRLRAGLRAEDSIARRGGDSFAILLTGLESPADADKICRKLHQAVAAQFEVQGHALYVTLSIGLALAGADDSDAASLIQHADAAMRRAKDLGRNRTEQYCDALSARLTERLLLQNGLHEAVQRQQLELHYQPQYDLARQRVVAFEALLRWRHAELGWVSPLQFIPIAEAAGFIRELTRYTLFSACRAAQRWQQAGRGLIRVAVNLSPRQLNDGELLDTIKAALADSSLPAAALELEITESACVDDIDAVVRLILRLRALGITVAMDDFGTGYASLANLRVLPFDCIKIDRSFVDKITENVRDIAIVRAVLLMAGQLRQRVVIEGVETAAQYALLNRLGCQHMQGYLFSRPLPERRVLGELVRGFNLALASADRQRYLLIVDDEVGNLNALRRALRGEPYQVLTATHVAQARELLALHPVGVVLCDQRMPGLSGTEFLRQVRVQYPEIVRMVLTGYTGLDSVLEAVNEGAVFKFMTKPWLDEQLRAHLLEAFRVHELAREVQQLREQISACA